MANKRIKDITTASTSFASDDFVITDSATSGTRKMTKDNLISQVSAGVSGDYLEESNNLSDVASKDTAKLNLEIPDIGLQANQVPLSGMLNSGAWLDFDAFYEEGTWTPTLSFGGGSTGWTYSSQEGYYTKIGNIAFIRGLVWVNAKGTSTGAAKIEGLPIGASSLGSASNVMPVIASSMLGLTSGVTALLDDGGTSISLYDAGSSGATGLNDTNFNGGEILRFSGTYQIA